MRWLAAGYAPGAITLALLLVAIAWIQLLTDLSSVAGTPLPRRPTFRTAPSQAELIFIPPRPMPVDAIRRVAGFPVLLLTDREYELVGSAVYDGSLALDQIGVTALLEYRHREDGGRRVTIRQLRSLSTVTFSTTAVTYDVRDVTVRGRQAKALFPTSRFNLQPAMVHWVEDGITYELISLYIDTLTLVGLANSLR